MTEHNHIVHEHVVIVSVETLPVPYVAEADRIELDDLGHVDDAISHVSVSYGYMESPDIPTALRLAEARGLECTLEVASATYFVSRIELGVGDTTGMNPWRAQLFVAISGIAADAADYVNLPRERTSIIGSQIDV